jgi:nucleotide-binding universal stress UspA family protein
MDAVHDISGARPAQAEAAFARVLCGVDGSPSALEAVRQAALLASPGGQLDLVCVRYAQGYGPNAQETISESRAQAALDEACEVARELGVAGTCLLASSPRRAETLIEHLPGHDLVAVGPHVSSRAGGIMLGSTASTLLHRSTVPVLAARRSREAEWHPRTVLAATDGSMPAAAAVELAGRIAARHGSSILLVSVGGDRRDADRRRVLAEQAASLEDACGSEVVLLTPEGNAHEQILAVAVQQSASLIVLGSRGRSGIRALGSVSERVAHRARCSVLVARGPAPR